MGALDDLIARTSGVGGGSRGQSLDELIKATSGGGTAGGSFEPDPNLSAPDPDPSMPKLSDEQPPWYTRALQTAQDSISGFTHGLTQHNDANLYDMVSRSAGDQVRARNAEAASRSPTAFGIADTVGGYLPGFVGGAALRAGSAMEAVGGAIGQGTVQGALQGFGNSSPDAPPGERALAAVKAANEGGTSAGLTAGVLTGVDELGNSLGNAATRARSAALGAGSVDLRKLSADRGLDFATDQLGRLPEDMGVTNRIIPQSAQDYARRIGGNDGQGAMIGEAGARVGQSLRDAEAQGVGALIDPGAMDQAMAQRVAAARNGPAGDAASEAAALQSVREGMARQNIQTPTQLRQLKTAYANRAYPDAVSGSSESLMGQAHRAGADVARGELEHAMGYALPETNSEFQQGTTDFGKLKLMDALARKAAASQYAGGGMLGNVGAGIAGAGVGALAGGSTGAAIGASAGLVRPAIAAARSYGPDLGANIGRLGESAIGAMNPGAMAQPAGSAAAVAAAKWLGSKGVQTGQPAPDNQANTVGESTSTGHGNRLGAAAAQMLRQNPNALGSWLQDFQKADQEGSGAMSALVGRLMIDDPAFRSGPGVQLQQMTR